MELLTDESRSAVEHLAARMRSWGFATRDWPQQLQAGHAKRPGRCRKCRHEFQPGDLVGWSAATGSMHASCVL